MTSPGTAIAKHALPEAEPGQGRTLAFFAASLDPGQGRTLAFLAASLDPGQGRCAPRPRSLLRSQARCALSSGASPREGAYSFSKTRFTPRRFPHNVASRRAEAVFQRGSRASSPRERARRLATAK